MQTKHKINNSYFQCDATILLQLEKKNQSEHKLACHLLIRSKRKAFSRGRMRFYLCTKHIGHGKLVCHMMHSSAIVGHCILILCGRIKGTASTVFVIQHRKALPLMLAIPFMHLRIQ